MEVVVQEVRETVNMASTAYNAAYTARHPFKSAFKKIGTFFGKKKVVDPAIETLNENFVEPIKEASSGVAEAVEGTVDNITEGVKNGIRMLEYGASIVSSKIKGDEEAEKKIRKINTIKSSIENNKGVDNIIASINEGDVKLNFRDRLEIIKYAIKRNRIEIAKSLIEHEAGIIRDNINKLKEQKNRIIELKKKKERLTKKQNMKNKWYGKVINFFNRRYFTKVENELNDNEGTINAEVEGNKNLIEENKVEYSYIYKDKDNSLVSNNYIKKFNDDVEEERRNNLELGCALRSLNNAIIDINGLFNNNLSMGIQNI